jgi:NAD(P)-dependent dehydrogenase (short-subunit alcohol dehydrogenase family)
MAELAASRSVVILGGASTVARAIAHEFARAGYNLVLADYDQEENALIATDVRVRCNVMCHALPFDATDYSTHAAFMDACTQALGEVPEGVVLCFGFMAEQAAAQADFAVARRTIDTNFTGAVSILEHFAAAFETRGGGFMAPPKGAFRCISRACETASIKPMSKY